MTWVTRRRPKVDRVACPWLIRRFIDATARILYVDPAEVMNTAQAAQFLQIDEAVVIDMAEAGKLPGRKLADAWRFSRAALVTWLSTPVTP